MLSVSVGAVRRSYLRISRARRRRTGSPPQGPPGTRSVGGLRTLRSFVEPASRIPAPLRQSSQAAGALETTASAPFFDRDVSGMCGRKVQGTNTVSKLRRASLAFSLSAVREVRRLMQQSCGSARHLQSCGRTSLPHHFRHRSSKVEFNLAAIPPGPLGLPLARQATKSLPGVQDTAVPAVGAASVSHCSRQFRPAASPGRRPVRHTLRGSPRISDIAACFYSTDSARERRRPYPARPSVLRSHSGPSRPRPRRPSA